MSPDPKNIDPPRLPRIFDEDPALKKKAEDYLKSIPAEQRKESVEKFKKFAAGEMTWAEIKGFPKEMLRELSRIAYDHFKRSDYAVAESLFKGLSVLDHTNWYYRAALGAIYQKQKIYDQAVEEYSVALLLNEKEIVPLTNRGECYMRLAQFDEALKDFEAAIHLDQSGKHPWAKRASALKNKLQSQEGKGDRGKGTEGK